MRIEIVSRDCQVDEREREYLRKRLERVGRQVSEHAILEVVFREEANPSIRDRFVAEATLRLKGVTLHAEERSAEIHHTIKALSDDIRRQVKQHREKRRKRTTTRRLSARARGRIA